MNIVLNDLVKVLKQESDTEDLCVGFGAVGCIFASDIMENKRYDLHNEFASEGQNKQVVYYHPNHMNAFIKIISKVVLYGCSDTFQAQMCGNDSIRGEIVVVRYNNPTTSFERVSVDGITIIGEEYKHLSFEEVCDMLVGIINEYKPKVVCFECMSVYASGHEPFEMVCAINRIAFMNDVLIFSGWQVGSFVPSLNEIVLYFNRQHSDLIYLIGGEELEQKYFSIIYGVPDSKELIYSIDEEGNVFVPEGVAKYLSLKKIVPNLLKYPLKQKDFKYALFGAFRGAYAFKSVESRIPEMIKWNMLKQSGSGMKTSVSLTVGEATQKIDRHCTALQGLTDFYSHKKRAKELLMRFEDFKMIVFNSQYGNSNITKFVALGFIEAVIKSGCKNRSLQDVYCVSSHRRMSVIAITDSVEYLQKRIDSMIVDSEYSKNIKVEALRRKITDVVFLEKLKTIINEFQPDFVFVLNIEQIDFSNMSVAQFVKQLKDISKKFRIAMIGEYSSLNGSVASVDDKDSLYVVEPMVYIEDYNEIQECTDYNFEKTFKISSSTNGYLFSTIVDLQKGKVRTTPTQVKKRVKYVSELYRVKRESICDVVDYITDLSMRDLKSAQKMGIIFIEGKGVNRVVTYNAHHSPST